MLRLQSGIGVFRVRMPRWQNCPTGLQYQASQFLTRNRHNTDLPADGSEVVRKIKRRFIRSDFRRTRASLGDMHSASPLRIRMLSKALLIKFRPIVLTHIFILIGIDRARVQLLKTVIITVDQIDVDGNIIIGFYDHLFRTD